MLRKLGLGTLSGAEAAGIDELHAVSPGGIRLDAPLPARLFGGQASMIRRAVLDEQLVQLATLAGARLREHQQVESVDIGRRGVKVRVRDCDAVEADVVLGCDGAASAVRRSLGARNFPKNHLAVGVRVYYEGVRLSRPRAFAVFWDKELLPGYGWIFPLPGGCANVGVGGRADLLERNGTRVRDLLERFCNLPAVQRELCGARRSTDPKGHPLPLGSFTHPLVHDRALLLGDAAGFINPLTGEGIEFALESGELAAETIRAADAAGDLSARTLDIYAPRCRQRFGAAFRLSYRMQAVFSQPWLVDRLFRAAVRSTAVQADLFDLLLAESPRITLRLLTAVALAM
jgi:geranylgeranyl reductase family protein